MNADVRGIWLDVVTTASAYVFLAVVGALALIALRWSSTQLRRSWLPLQRLRHISWHGVDVLTAFFIWLAIPILVSATLRKAGFFDRLYEGMNDTPTRERQWLWASLLAQPLALGLILLGLQQIRGTRLAELGLTFVRAGRNVAIGYVLWLIMLPLGEVIEAIAEWAMPQGWVDEHFVSIAAQHSLALAEWVVLFITAVVLAPLSEEIIFRGILLPWQLRGGWEAQATIGFCAFLAAALLGVREQPVTYNPGPVVFVAAMLLGIFLIPFLSIFGSKLMSESHPHSVAIFTNGLFFAAMHSGIWPSPIPLFVLGMALAWVTYRTSSLIGAIALHALFNAVSAIALLLKAVLS
jgi:membrane protease YdiL (CAAX protease family)